MRTRWLAPAGLAAIVLLVGACGTNSGSGSSGSSGSSTASAAPANASSGTQLKVATVGGHKVLTNAKGFVLYWFAPDTPTKSVCNGACATAWPPVPGPAKAGPGVTGPLGTVKRADGSIQATYRGHPLYTFEADKKPGQANGNGLDAGGGKWWEMTVSGKVIKAGGSAPAPAPSSSPSSGGGGGYGY
jgi:predicted lipoprotein with Yx(FWY)xxD motif